MTNADPDIQHIFQENLIFFSYFFGLLVVGMFVLFGTLFRAATGSLNLEFRIKGWKLRHLDFWFFIFLVFSVWVLTPFISQLIVTPSSGNGNSGASVGNILFTITTGLLMQTGMIAVFHFFRTSLPESLQNGVNCVSKNLYHLLIPSLGIFLAAYPIIIGVSLVWNLFLSYLSEKGLNISLDPQPLTELFLEVQTPVPLFLMIFMTVIMASLTEELIFRAGIYRFMKSRMHPALAMVGSSFLFGLIHVNLISFFPLFIVGIVLCLIYEITGNIKSAMIFHSLFNLNAILLLIYQPSIN